MPKGLTDVLVDILRRRKAAGQRTAFLHADVARTFFAVPRARSGQQRPMRPSSRPPSRPSASPLSAREQPSGTTVGAPPVPIAMPLPEGPVEMLDWQGLSQRIAQCRVCGLCRSRTQTVMGDGSQEADLLFIGEGPGREEDLQGRPFVGPAGQLLDRMILAMQFSRPDVYIANIVKCRPPHNRNPEPQEAEACLPYLYRQIELLSPKVIVLLGAVPLLFLLGEKGIRRHRGQWRDFRGIPVMPTYHPAYLIRAPQCKGEAWSDLQQVMQRFGKDPRNTVRSR